MNHTIIRAMVVCTALLSGGAFADGVPLIIAGPGIAASDPVRGAFTGAPEVTKIHSIIVNEAAFSANVITAMVDGKEYRFVGRIVDTRPGYSSWVGRDPGLDRAVLVLTKSAKGGALLGSIEMTGRRLTLQQHGGRYFLIERDPNLFKNPLPYKAPEIAADPTLLKGVRK